MNSGMQARQTGFRHAPMAFAGAGGHFAASSRPRFALEHLQQLDAEHLVYHEGYG